MEQEKKKKKRANQLASSSRCPRTCSNKFSSSSHLAACKSGELKEGGGERKVNKGKNSRENNKTATNLIGSMYAKDLV